VGAGDLRVSGASACPGPVRAVTGGVRRRRTGAGTPGRTAAVLPGDGPSRGRPGRCVPGARRWRSFRRGKDGVAGRG